MYSIEVKLGITFLNPSFILAPLCIGGAPSICLFHLCPGPAQPRCSPEASAMCDDLRNPKWCLNYLLIFTVISKHLPSTSQDWSRIISLQASISCDAVIQLPHNSRSSIKIYIFLSAFHQRRQFISSFFANHTVKLISN